MILNKFCSEIWWKLLPASCTLNWKLKSTFSNSRVEISHVVNRPFDRQMLPPNHHAVSRPLSHMVFQLTCNISCYRRKTLLQNSFERFWCQCAVLAILLEELMNMLESIKSDGYGVVKVICQTFWKHLTHDVFTTVCVWAWLLGEAYPSSPETL